MPANVPDGSIYSYETAAGLRWGFVIDAPAADGKSRRQTRRHRDADGRPLLTKAAAREARDALRDKLRAGVVPKPADGTVAAFAEEWVAALPAEGLEPATVLSYEKEVARLLPAIGAIRLQDLTALDLDRAYAALRELGRAPRTIRASHVAVRKMLGEALRLKVVGENVSAAARPPRAKSTRAKRFPTWDIDQLDRFLAAVADDPHFVLWWVLAFTGMRRGEVVTLRWDDVDLDGGTIRVERAMGMGRGRVLAEKVPKSDAGRRLVELDPDTIAVLKDHRRKQLELRLLVGPGWQDKVGLVFTEPDGRPVDPDRVTGRWRDLVRVAAPKAGVPVIRCHDLRHSHATQLLASGTRPDIVTKRLGHSSVAFTLATYGHVYEGDERAAMSRLLASRKAAPALPLAEPKEA